MKMKEKNWIKKNTNLLIIFGVIGLMIIVFFNKDISKEGVSIPIGTNYALKDISNLSCNTNLIEVNIDFSSSGVNDVPISLEVFDSNNNSLGIDSSFDFNNLKYYPKINSTHFLLNLGEVYNVKISFGGFSETIQCTAKSELDMR
jgi:hypothetical protein